MKKTTRFIVAVLIATLAVYAMAGCAGQSASSASSAASGQSQDPALAELKQAFESIPSYNSVTVSETFNSGAFGSEGSSSGEIDSYDSTTIYKYEDIGGTLKTSMVPAKSGEFDILYYTDGDKAVYVEDGIAYSGTTEDFAMLESKSVDSLVDSTFYGTDKILESAKSVTKAEADGITTYTIDVDATKYMDDEDSDEAQDSAGDIAEEADMTCVIVVGFDADGRIASISRSEKDSDFAFGVEMKFYDYDNTTADPAPEATKTYADLQATYEEMEESMDKE